MPYLKKYIYIQKEIDCSSNSDFKYFISKVFHENKKETVLKRFFSLKCLMQPVLNIESFSFLYFFLNQKQHVQVFDIYMTSQSASDELNFRNK